MALNFPNSPTNGQLYTDSASGNRWVWDSGNTCWVSTSTFTQTITVASTAPGSPVAGQLWWNKDYGRLLVYYTDDNTSQWVDASPSDYTSQLAYGVANAAFAKANNALANTSGISTAGNLTVPGNLGIGISSPSYKLQVEGEMFLGRVDSSTEGGQISFARASDNSLLYAIDVNGSGSSPEFRLFNQAGGVVFFSGSPNGVNYIKFNPTQLAIADANCLDDYEEGTWTPTASASSGTITSYTASGTYTKIGRVVQVNFLISITNVGTANAQVLNFGGLPFTVSNSTKPVGVCRENAVSGFLAQVLADQTLTTGNILKYDNGGVIVAGGNFHCSIVYYTT